MEENKIRRLYQSGKFGFGIFIHIPSPIMVDLCANAGYDWVNIPQKYTSDVLFLENMVSRAEAGGIGIVARVPFPPDPSRVDAVLSTGVDGIMMECESKQEAEDLVSMCRVPPVGTRSAIKPIRQTKYNVEYTLEEFRRKVNQQVIIVHLTSMKAVEHCEEIFSVPGIEGAGTDSSSLSNELGVARGDPAVREAKLRVAKAAKATGVTYAPDARTPRHVLDWLETDGAKHLRTFSQATDIHMVTRGFREMMEGNKEAAEEGKLSGRWSTFHDGR